MKNLIVFFIFSLTLSGCAKQVSTFEFARPKKNVASSNLNQPSANDLNDLDLNPDFKFDYNIPDQLQPQFNELIQKLNPEPELNWQNLERSIKLADSNFELKDYLETYQLLNPESTSTLVTTTLQPHGELIQTQTIVLKQKTTIELFLTSLANHQKASATRLLVKKIVPMLGLSPIEFFQTYQAITLNLNRISVSNESQEYKIEFRFSAWPRHTTSKKISAFFEVGLKPSLPSLLRVTYQGYGFSSAAKICLFQAQILKKY